MTYDETPEEVVLVCGVNSELDPPLRRFGLTQSRCGETRRVARRTKGSILEEGESQQQAACQLHDTSHNV
jgi:hypothetical protein